MARTGLCIVVLLLAGLAASGVTARIADAGQLSIAERQVLVGSELDYPPFAMVTADGQPDGFAVELFRAVAQVSGLDVTFHVAPWTEILTGLREGRLDALPFVAISPERSEYLDFSAPVVTSHGAIFVRNGEVAINSEADLRGRQILVMRDDIAHEYARRQPWATDLVLVNSLEEAFRLLAAGRYDAVAAPRLSGLLLLRDLGISGIRVLDVQLEGFVLNYAIAVRKGNDSLLARLNGGLSIVIADGTLAEITDRWLPDLRPTGIARDTVAAAILALVAIYLITVTLLYLRQRRLMSLATARGVELESKAAALTELADRLEEARRGAEIANAQTLALLKLMPDLMFRLDRDDCFVDWHDPGSGTWAAAKTFMGRQPRDVLPGAAGEAAERAVRAAKATGEVQTVEYELPAAGVQQVFEAKVVPTPDGGALAVVRDVTAARERERQLTRAAEAVAAASAAKTRLLAAMSHELRTPLNAIIGFSDMMRQEVLGPVSNEHYRGYTDDIFQSGNDLLALINNVLDLSKIESGRFELREEPVAVGEIIAKQARFLQPVAAATGTSITVSVPADLPAIRADQCQVGRMLMNLMGNAVKFTEGGSVTVTAELGRDGGVRIAIADTGIGMTNGQLSHLGEPFYQANPAVARKRGGTGLGVALVKEMISLHGGSLRFTSEPGRGTRCELAFPPERTIRRAHAA